MDIDIVYILLPLLLAWFADRIIGDPQWLPHPVVAMGKIIAFGDKILNEGCVKYIKGVLFAIVLVLSCFFLPYFIIKWLDSVNIYISILFSAVLIFYSLAGKNLIDEVKKVFLAVDSSLEEGRVQVSRIVGRDTSNLSSQQVRTAALETLSENLSDGVIAPLFWYMLLGVPGMFAYKMVNTLDSMIGYKNDKYREFGCWSARMDDVFNYIPSRLTAFLMIVVSGDFSLLKFVAKYGRQHASPNSGYPEAALAGILNCRFGGPNIYFGQVVEKPYIGYEDKILTTEDMEKAVKINIRTESVMVVCILLLKAIIWILCV